VLILMFSDFPIWPGTAASGDLAGSFKARSRADGAARAVHFNEIVAARLWLDAGCWLLDPGPSGTRR
jgi:hypothetical protein